MNHEKAFKSRYFIISTGKIKCIGFDLAFGKTTKISISFLYKLYEFFYFTFRENSVYNLYSVLAKKRGLDMSFQNCISDTGVDCIP